MDGRIYRIASDTHPRFVGVDLSRGKDMGCECEVEVLPDGAIRVLDVRYTTPGPHGGQTDE